MEIFTKKGLIQLGIMNLKAQDRICKFLRFTKLIALIFTLCVLSCVTAYAEDTTYIDENGNSKTVNATVLDGTETWLDEGWYVVKDNKPSYSKTLLLGANADVRIILADGGAMTIDASPRGIQCNESGLGHLYIYGQSANTGTLTINSAGTGIKVTNYTQNGGTVIINPQATNANGIFAASNVNINGGSLTINSNSYAIYAGDYAGGIRYKGYITINDGQVSADTGFKAGPIDIVYGSSLKGEITLGLKSSTSYIKAGSYQAETVKIADNETLFVKNEYGSGYSGTLTANQISAIENCQLVLNPEYLCKYIDENGSEKSVYATPITSTTTTLTDGWYVVNDNITLADTLSLSGNSDVNIILADSATLNIGTNSSPLTYYGIHDKGIHNLRIYGQSGQTGTLSIDARYPINVGSSFTQNGGKVILSASGNSQGACGIYAEHTVNINNGTLNITVNGAENSHAVSVGYNQHTAAIKGGITISGGQVTVTGADLNAGSEGTITLGYRKNTDSITAASYTAGTVKVADGQAFYVKVGNTETVYLGTLNSEQITAIKEKTLNPYQIHTISYNYALSDGESLLSEGYIMVISLDESAVTPSLLVDGNTRDIVSLSGNMYMALLYPNDLSASNFTLKATNSGSTSFIFVSENPADDLAPGTYDIRLNSKTTKGMYAVIPVSAGDLNPGAYATSALPLTLVNPTRKGYTFTGWTGTNLTTATKDYKIPTTATGDLSYTANWTLDTYTITYNEVDSNPDVTSYTVNTDTFTLNNPEKSGYTFLGWTGTGLNGAAQSVTIPKGSTGNRTYTAVWQESFSPTQTNEPEIAQHAMILGSQIVVVFHVYLPEGSSSADYKMDFDVSGDKAENPGRTPAFEAITEGSHTLYGYKCYVNSVQMADTIHAKLYSGDTVVLSEDYTAKTYLDRVIASADVFSSATVNLCKAIKDYGHYVQIPLAAENKWVIGEKHKAMDASNTYNDDDVLLAKQGAEDYALSKTIDGTGLKEFTYALYLDSKTTLVVSFDSDVSDIACASGDVNNNIVTIADISAHELGNKYTITGKATSDFTITISPLSYVHSVLNDNEDKNGIKYGVTSLYNYYYRTMKYRLRHSSD